MGTGSPINQVSPVRSGRPGGRMGSYNPTVPPEAKYLPIPM